MTMAQGRKRLQKIQLGKETTAGTAVACTTVWRGAGAMLDDQRLVEEVEEMVGLLDGADRTNVTKLMGGLELAQTPVTFEQFPYLPVMSMGGPVTGSADGSGSDKIYTTNVPTTAAPTLVPYTIRGGDDFEVEIMEYALLSKWEVAFKAGESAKLSATALGRQVQASSFTGSLSIPSIEDVLSSKGKVYLDDVSGSYGTTQVANAIIAGKVTVEIKYAINFTIDGNLYYSYLTYAGHRITGELTYVHDSAVSGSGGAKQFFRNQTAKLLELKFEGATVTTPGTTYSKKTLIIDLPIKFGKAGVLADQDGGDIVTMSFRSRYNTTKGDAGKFVVVNELASLP
jgi:hypothetical protein